MYYYHILSLSVTDRLLVRKPNAEWNEESCVEEILLREKYVFKRYKFTKKEAT